MAASQADITAYKASILHFTESPSASGEGVEYFPEGLLVVRHGKVEAVGPEVDLLPVWLNQAEYVDVVDLSGQLIMPGFFDSHVHFPQIDIIGSYGEQLLDWLNNYTFPAEARFGDVEYAKATAKRFFQAMFSAGTTTAMVYCTSHAHSVEAFFQESQRNGSLMIAGKVLMDRNAPDNLTDTAEQGWQDSQQLIDQWHNTGRQKYVVTPRFAPTSTDAQMRSAGKLLADNPGVYMQTHLSENLAELAWVKELYPERKHYLDVYDHFGLLGPRSVFGHGIHLCEDEWQRLADTGSGIAFCPTSNLFLGSGLFDLTKAQECGVPVSLATDVGAGTNLCQLVTLNEAYKVTQLRGHALHPFVAFYWLTLGNAKALHLDNTIGNFAKGKVADFIVMDPSRQPLTKYRFSQCKNLAEQLFVLMTLGDDRLISHTYIAGQCRYQAETLSNHSKEHGDQSVGQGY